MKNILVTGAQGQIGTDLLVVLRQRFGTEHVVATDLRPSAVTVNGGRAHFEQLDVLDAVRLDELVRQYEIDTVYHLASLLSAVGEAHPDRAWEVNMNGLKNVLEVARARKLRVFWPSSIAVFGPQTPRNGTPQDTILDPTTIYGVTKVSGELLCRYYAQRYGVDVRSVRYPGIISHTAPPGGGTTDYAVDIFHSALTTGSFRCFVRPDTILPMMYMPDALKATLGIMDAEPDEVRVRTSYNVSAVHFSAEELVNEIRRYLPNLQVTYEPDFHQDIADSWPAYMDDSRARKDWGWKHDWRTEAIVKDMIEKLSLRYNKPASVSVAS